MKNLYGLFFTILSITIVSANSNKFSEFKRSEKTSNFQIAIPLAGNAYSSKHIEGVPVITDNGIENWTDAKEYFTVYFRISKPGNFQFAINDFSIDSGKTELEFAINAIAKKVKINTSSNKKINSHWHLEYK
ncbi:DUF5077 domain-containing protein [Flavobacterium flabelliforme]|uniref:DUF5077 domain-containing protein n=1 Tax=Flavobacterium flabelliforme TaxID=2816119 RepID=UPI001F316E2C|nr:DUF5077 domain-containing protein [Flavobacterium flabelliforme]